jgi:hypothetical protein
MKRLDANGFSTHHSEPEWASDALEATYRELSVHLAKDRDANESRTPCGSTFRLCAVAWNSPPLKSSINLRGCTLCMDTRFGFHIRGRPACHELGSKAMKPINDHINLSYQGHTKRWILCLKKETTKKTLVS